MLRIPHCLDNRLKDGGKVVSLTHQPHFTSQKPYYFNVSGTHFIIRIIKSRRMRWAGNVARMGEKRNAFRLLVGKPEGKRPLGRPRPRRVNNISMDLGEVGWGDVDWIDLAKDRNRWRALVNSVLNLRVP
jgi:hypothetical protein